MKEIRDLNNNHYHYHHICMNGLKQLVFGNDIKNMNFICVELDIMYMN